MKIICVYIDYMKIICDYTANNASALFSETPHWVEAFQYKRCVHVSQEAARLVMLLPSSIAIATRAKVIHYCSLTINTRAKHLQQGQ